MIVVADTSIFLNLCAARQQELIRNLFPSVCVPPEVRTEFENAARRLHRFAGLSFPAWVEIRPALVAHASLRANAHLDPGELAALELALELRADAVLIDETNGRLAAIRLGLTTFGVLGILLRSKEAGLLPAVAPVLTQLEAARFFLSPAQRENFLRRAGEIL